VRAAIVNSCFAFPPGRLLVNLAPADMRKAGVGFDLPIALALLATDEQLDGEALDVTSVYSIAGLLGARPRVVTTRPFRSPHHTASRVSLVGGV